jgi:acyl carrier protein
MTREEIMSLVLKILGTLAPEADLPAIELDADLRDAIDLDSMDLLTFATRIHERLGIDVPEAEASELVTLKGCVDYLSRRLGMPAG